MTTPTAAPPRLDREQRDEAILALLPMVRNIAAGLARFARNADPSDCFHDGVLGAIRAVDTFDPSRGIMLKRYARPIVTGAILNGLRERDPVSEIARRRLRQAEEERFRRAHELGRLPSMQEMEDEMPELRPARIAAHRSDTYSLDAPLPAGEREPGDWTNDPAEVAAAREERAAVRRAVAALPPRERKIIVEHFYGERSATQIAKTLNVTPQRVSQIRSGTLRTLRTLRNELPQ